VISIILNPFLLSLSHPAPLRFSSSFYRLLPLSIILSWEVITFTKDEMRGRRRDSSARQEAMHNASRKKLFCQTITNDYSFLANMYLGKREDKKVGLISQFVIEDFDFPIIIV